MNTNDYHRRPQDELPYEQRMKHIILGYRCLFDKLEKLVPYTKKLELINDDLKEKIAKKGFTNKKLTESLTEKNRENKRLKAHIEWLKERLSEKDG